MSASDLSLVNMQGSTITLDMLQQAYDSIRRNTGRHPREVYFPPGTIELTRAQLLQAASESPETWDALRSSIGPTLFQPPKKNRFVKYQRCPVCRVRLDGSPWTFETNHHRTICSHSDNMSKFSGNNKLTEENLRYFRDNLTAQIQNRLEATWTIPNPGRFVSSEEPIEITLPPRRTTPVVNITFETTRDWPGTSSGQVIVDEIGWD